MFLFYSPKPHIVFCVVYFVKVFSFSQAFSDIVPLYLYCSAFQPLSKQTENTLCYVKQQPKVHSYPER